jgi:PadR family transcriptional regulator, regulatory protein PadR
VPRRNEHTLLVADHPSPQLRRGATEIAILALLRDRRSYGLELVDSLASGGLVTSPATVYTVLARLRRLRFVTSEHIESGAGPKRHYHSLTPRGLEALREFADEWRTFRDAVDRAVGLRD